MEADAGVGRCYGIEQIQWLVLAGTGGGPSDTPRCSRHSSLQGFTWFSSGTSSSVQVFSKAGVDVSGTGYKA